MVIPMLLMLAAGALAAAAEWWHARRVARVARLAFGPTAKPALWARAAPVLRIVGFALAVFGATILLRFDPIDADVKPNPRASRQLLIALDVSPSMQVKDAGPDAEKITRARWAGKVVQAILDRLDMKDTRISLVAFYSKALTVLQDTTDKNVVSNMMDGLPMHVAFEPGTTDLNAGVTEALKLAKPWARKSATLVIISDGDAEKPATPWALPPSIADTIVIGVGDTSKATLVSGHGSRQNTWSLKQLAARLGGVYHEGNQRHLPTAVLNRLTMLAPRAASVLSERELGLASLAVGAALIGGLGPLLMAFGLPGAFARARRQVDARRASGVRSTPGARPAPLGAER